MAKERDPLLGMVAAILCGGLGTRLKRVVADRPKGLARVGGRPFLELILQQLGRIEVTGVVLCTGHLGEQISEHFGERWGGLRLAYSREASPLGTGGALRLALPYFSDHSVLVLNGDSYYRGDLTPLFKEHASRGAAASILLSQVENTQRYGLVELGRNGEIAGFLEKDASRTGGGWVNAGVYVIESSIISDLPPNKPISLEREVFPGLIGKGLYGSCGTGEFIDIGTPESFLKAGAFVAGGSSD